VERGNPEQVTAEVETALEIFRGQPGFILSPVDNVRELSPAIETNLQALTRAWRASWS
jgi:hypothetical protein